MPIRLTPGQGLRRALKAAVTQRECTAAFVLTCIGSLAQAGVRFAGKADRRPVIAALEILMLCATMAVSASHLHASLARSNGEFVDGHTVHGCAVQTTAKVLLAPLPERGFTRACDSSTDDDELIIHR